MFPYTLNPPTLSQNYASRGIFRYHLPLTLWWKQGPLKVRCIRAVPLCSMSISKGSSMIWVILAPQSCIKYFIWECFLDRVSRSVLLFSGIIFLIDCPLLKWKVQACGFARTCWQYGLSLAKSSWKRHFDVLAVNLVFALTYVWNQKFALPKCILRTACVRCPIRRNCSWAKNNKQTNSIAFRER